jgi:hypothetical protein
MLRGSAHDLFITALGDGFDLDQAQSRCAEGGRLRESQGSEQAADLLEIPTRLPSSVPNIAAAALASYLLKQPYGGETVRTMIIDDIHKALDEGRIRHAAELFMALRIFSNIIPKDVLDYL